eukprot:129929_1
MLTMSLTHFLVLGYIHRYTRLHNESLSDGVTNTVSFVCYKYIHGVSPLALKSAASCPAEERNHLERLPLQSAATEPGFKKIRVHCKKGDDTQQFSYFVGQQVNGLYDKLIINAQATFAVNSNALKIYNPDPNSGRRSYVEDIGDLVDKLDDSGDKNKYLHLFVEQENEDGSKLGYLLPQSQSNNASNTPSAAPTTPSTQYLLAAQEMQQQPRTSGHFRTISDSSLMSDSDSSSSDSESDDDASLVDIESDEVVLRQSGYQIKETIAETFRGCIYEAQTLDDLGSKQKNNYKWSHLTSTDAQPHVAIKKVMKDRFDPQNDCAVTKEAAILHYLTVQNTAPHDNLCNFVELIETNTAFYLVEEYGTAVTLAKLTEKAHQHMKEGRLDKKEWRVCTKYIFWHWVVHMYWMNYDMNCCHLGLNMDNILIKNVHFVPKIGGDALRIDCKGLCIKLCDLSESEVFSFDVEPTKFACVKTGISSDNCRYQSPELFDGKVFHPMKAEAWSMGVVLHTMFTGSAPYQYPDASDEGFVVLQNNALAAHLKKSGFGSYISRQGIQLMKALLNVDAEKRWDMKQLLHCDWFKNYYKKQKSSICKKSKTQRERHIRQQELMKQFPFYQLPAATDEGD